jgi:hypothetical protein
MYLFCISNTLLLISDSISVSSKHSPILLEQPLLTVVASTSLVFIELRPNTESALQTEKRVRKKSSERWNGGVLVRNLSLDIFFYGFLELVGVNDFF